MTSGIGEIGWRSSKKKGFDCYKKEESKYKNFRKKSKKISMRVSKKRSVKRKDWKKIRLKALLIKNTISKKKLLK